MCYMSRLACVNSACKIHDFSCSIRLLFFFVNFVDFVVHSFLFRLPGGRCRLGCFLGAGAR